MPGVYYATRAGCTELCWEWWGGRSVCFRLHHYGGLVSTASVSHSPGSGWAWSAVCPVGLLGFLFPAAHHLVELWPSGGHMLFLLFTNHQLESSEDISDRVAFSSHIRSKIFPVLLQKLNLFTCKFVYYFFCMDFKKRLLFRKRWSDGRVTAWPVCTLSCFPSPILPDPLFFFAGRAPETKALGLDKLGVQISKETGKIIVGPDESSSLPNIYAFGDIGEVSSLLAHWWNSPTRKDFR